MPESRYTGIGARKSHRKSRLGCVTCKRRRIRCDEGQPRCQNCIKHDIICKYAHSAHTLHATPTSSTTTSPSVAQEPDDIFPIPTPTGTVALSDTSGENRKFTWSATTAELMHQWVVSTSQVLTEDPITKQFMQISVPRLAFAEQHILHLILAISALHLVHLKPEKKGHYADHAERHYQAGLQLIIPLLTQLNEENCHTIFLFATLCNGHSLAQGPRPGDYLLFGEDGPAQWSALFRGLLPLLSSYSRHLMDGPMAAMIRPGAAAACQPPVALPKADNDVLLQLEHFVNTVAGSDEEMSILAAALQHLRALYSSRYTGDGQKRRATIVDLGIWLWRCTEGLTELLQRRHPGALVIFAYACVVINDIGNLWLFTGWVSHLLAGIHRSLPPQYHVWIESPMQDIGWLPP
ncbi:hypothetical protein BKA63DRAFT_237273 [Paraphoma chrysanthemicola]|nr:hypothetical protein BKA63DRAFT_237273 [Paraphoma chrysanthemicola]